MSQTVRQIFKIVAICFALAGVGCASDEPKLASKQVVAVSKIFPYKMETVWRAAQLCMKYTPAINNQETGVLETEWVKSIDGFQNPANPEAMDKFGFRYKLILNAVRGKNDSRPLIRVTISKKYEKAKDFFSEYKEAFNSDGLEEKAILYRMEREIVIDEAIKKASEKASATSR